MTNPSNTPPGGGPYHGGALGNGSSKREQDDDYERVIIILKPRWRVVYCSQGCQFILQKKEASHAGPWRAQKYVSSREALIELCGRLGLLSDSNAEATLLSQPEYAHQIGQK